MLGKKANRLKLKKAFKNTSNKLKNKRTMPVGR